MVVDQWLIKRKLLWKELCRGFDAIFCAGVMANMERAVGMLSC
jgi:hypothetical protein